ncbi:hypothetical protein M5D96_002289, partial [Drosophila gunungcola]
RKLYGIWHNPIIGLTLGEKIVIVSVVELQISPINHFVV